MCWARCACCWSPASTPPGAASARASGIWPRTPKTAGGSSPSPSLMPTAIEEFLRAYAPVTMAREVKQETEINGCTFKPGEMVMLSFPAANRDPEMFPDADKVIIDRKENRHAAFGLGIHRCIGSNLARMELTVAVEELLEAHPGLQPRRRGDVVGGHRARPPPPADQVRVSRGVLYRDAARPANVTYEQGSDPSRQPPPFCCNVGGEGLTPVLSAAVRAACPVQRTPSLLSSARLERSATWARATNTAPSAASCAACRTTATAISPSTCGARSPSRWATRATSWRAPWSASPSRIRGSIPATATSPSCSMR